MKDFSPPLISFPLLNQIFPRLNSREDIPPCGRLLNRGQTSWLFSVGFGRRLFAAAARMDLRACRGARNPSVVCVCVTWALGREVCLPYYDQLRSRLVTSPLSLLLTRIKGFYESQLSLLPPTSHSFLLSDKVMSASFGTV
jgi:hypothetical protein